MSAHSAHTDGPNAPQETIASLKEAMDRLESGQPAAPSEVTPADLSPDAASQQEKAKAVVLRKLTGSAKSRHQLAQTLRDREFGEDVIVAVLDRLEAVNLIDDAAFAQSWVRTRYETRGLGRAALGRELRDRGVADQLIEAALDQLSDEDEAGAARDLLEKKLRGVVIPAGGDAESRKERDKHTRRLVAMLARRGHAPGAAFRLVREVMDEHAHSGS